MKKSVLFTVLFFSILSASLCADSNSQNESKDLRWQEVKESGKEALSGIGNFFKNLGKTLKTDVTETVSDISEIKCIGKWNFNKKSTIIIIRDDNTFEITQKQKNETHFWKGSYSATLKLLTLTIEEEGNESWQVSNISSTQKPEKWYLYYGNVDEDSVKFSCSSIPTDIDGNSFSNGQIFTK